ncbi:MAG: hypothetical protein P1P93_01905 [Gammaproteobacteria bacterium]|nr:hypothetical protein [Gammaproteobacteria bacterium]
MTTISAYQSGLTGIQTGLQSLNQNAGKIASATSIESTSNLTEPLIGMMSDKQQIEASANVIEASNSMLGTILDIKV